MIVGNGVRDRPWRASSFRHRFSTTVDRIVGTSDCALIVLLAGLAGGRGSACRFQKTAADRPASRRAKGIPPHPRRYHRRDGVLEPDSDRDHSHRRRDVSPRRQDRYRDVGAGRRSLKTDRGPIRGSDLRARHRRHRPAGDPSVGRLGSLCRRRRTTMAGRAGAQAEGGGRVLYGAGAVGGDRNYPQFHARHTGARSSTVCLRCP